MKARAFVLAALCAAAGLAHAQFSADYDTGGRIRKVEYRDDLVLKVRAYTDHPIMIELEGDEDIVDAAGGVIAHWEMTKRGKRLFARPLPEARPSTVVVGTKSRSYVVELLPGGDVAPRTFVSKVVITQPPPPAPPAPPAPSAEEVKRKAEEAKLKAEAPGLTAAELVKNSTPADEARYSVRNQAYTLEAVREEMDVRPREVFDDGRFTYFLFPKALAVPVIYKSSPGSSQEWLVNSHKDGDYMVVHSIAKLWNIRAPGTLLGVFNEAYDPVGVDTPGNTTVRGVVRESVKTEAGRGK